MCTSNDSLPQNVRVRIEVTKGSHIKRGSHGEVDFVSPIPCPWNYGSAIATVGPDGDPIDVVVLGAPIARDEVVKVELQGRIPFLDGGVIDDKWIAAAGPLDADQIRTIERFFTRYAKAKRIHGRIRFRSGETRADRYQVWKDER